MRLFVNGEERMVEANTTIADLVREFGAGRELGVAVAVNGEVVAKSAWDGVSLSEEDRIEVLRAIGGG
jgi:sulfur carrier protein